MARIRSPRQWWRDSVLAPLDATFTRIDEDLDELTDALPGAAAVPPTHTAPGPTRVQLERSA